MVFFPTSIFRSEVTSGFRISSDHMQAWPGSMKDVETVEVGKKASLHFYVRQYRSRIPTKSLSPQRYLEVVLRIPILSSVPIFENSKFSQDPDLVEEFATVSRAKKKPFSLIASH